MFLSRRRLRPEVMDQPGLDPRRHAHALRGLARINFWSGSAGILWHPLAALARELAPRPPRILDVASGGGDVPVRLWRRAEREVVALEVVGVYLSLAAVEHAGACAAH